MRNLYLDEAGIGKITHDPILVVAGVLIHADLQWKSVAERLASLLKESTPTGAPVPICLHAKDIFHGSGEFDRKIWPIETRFQLLDAMAEMLSFYKLPVIFCSVDRKEHISQFPDDPPEDHLPNSYSIAALTCFLQADLFMRVACSQDEVAGIVLEKNAALQRRIQSLFEFAKDPFDTERLRPYWRQYMPIRSIIDAPSYQTKTSSNILQLADFCAFALKRGLQGSSYADRWYKPVLSQCVLQRPATDHSPPIYHPVFERLAAMAGIFWDTPAKQPE